MPFNQYWYVSSGLNVPPYRHRRESRTAKLTGTGHEPKLTMMPEYVSRVKSYMFAGFWVDFVKIYNVDLWSLGYGSNEIEPKLSRAMNSLESNSQHIRSACLCSRNVCMKCGYIRGTPWFCTIDLSWESLFVFFSNFFERDNLTFGKPREAAEFFPYKSMTLATQHWCPDRFRLDVTHSCFFFNFLLPELATGPSWCPYFVYT